MGTHEDQNRLLQAIGGSEPPKPRCGGADLEPEDVLLLCSDGFWERLKPEEMAGLVNSPRSQRSETLEKTLQLAVDRGEAKADNGTVVMACFSNWHHSLKPPPALRGCRGALIFIIAASAVAMAAFSLLREEVIWLWQKHLTPVLQPPIPEPARLNHPSQTNK
jgi:serine/threonine protein phosphatase PrpC